MYTQPNLKQRNFRSFQWGLNEVGIQQTSTEVSKNLTEFSIILGTAVSALANTTSFTTTQGCRTSLYKASISTTCHKFITNYSNFSYSNDIIRITLSTQTNLERRNICPSQRDLNQGRPVCVLSRLGTQKLGGRCSL